MSKQIKGFGLINIIGPQCDQFLQGQLTCDITKLNQDIAKLCAHLNPKGRVISLFFIMRHPGGFYLLLPKNLIKLTLNALQKYAVFYKIKLTDDSENQVAYINQQNIAHLDVPHFQMQPANHQLYIFPANSPINEEEKFLTESTWLVQLIEQKIPVITPQTSGLFLPHELNLPELDAIAFDKGCYTGQEIVARMHYKGKSKKVLLTRTHVAKAAPLSGDTIYDNDKPVGTVINSACLNLNEKMFKSLLLLDNHDLICKPLKIGS